MAASLKRWTALLAALWALVAAGSAFGAPPAGVTGLALNGKVELSWEPAAGASAYNVYRGTSPASITTLITPPGGVVTPGYNDTTAVNGGTYYYAVRSIIAGAESVNSLVVQASPQAQSCNTGNEVVRENCYPGSTAWHVLGADPAGAGGIEGFATKTSIAKSDSVQLKVTTQAGVAYRIEIYRSGWYGGAGGRLYSIIRGVTGVTQPACASTATTGLYDCSNWSTSATVTTTASWPSGVYLLRLVREDNDSDTHVLLIVRDDARTSDVLYGVPTATYQAYNNYGGKSLYSYHSTGANTVAGTPRAVKVSFERPYIQPRDALIPNWYPRSDLPFVSWLERSGYDVAYQADLDLETRPVGSHRAYVSGAHDEYWSGAMRTALEQARGAGTSLFFSGSNAVYWRIRFENGTRTEVCYKTTESGPNDPIPPTGTWRDPGDPNTGRVGADNPENALIGQFYIGDHDGVYFPLVVNAAEGTDRVYRYTGLETQAPGTSTSIGAALVGWEWDRREPNGREPAGVKTLATSPVNGNLVQNNGASYTQGNATSNVTKYVASSGALVFSTGTNHWGRGLALNGDGAGEPDRRIQQTTTNAFSDMGVSPQTPAGNITLDDAAAPRVASTSPADGATQVQPTASVTATFSRAMNAATITASSFKLKKADGTAVSGTVSYDSATATARLVPSAQLAFSTTYIASLDTTVKASDGTPLQTPNSWSFTTRSAQLPVRVNVGGAAFTDSGGNAYLADQYFTGGTIHTSSSPIAGTPDDLLYQNERWGQFSYAVPVVNGTYDVNLHLAELYFGAPCDGKRLFGFDVLDTPTSPDVSAIDVCAAAGGPNAAYVRTIYSVPITDGVLNLQSVYGTADDPELVALELVPSTGPPPAPTVTTTTPANAATSVGTGVRPTATFSRAMDAATITSSSFTLRITGGALVPATVAYSAATSVATLTPSAALANSTSHTARLETTIKASDGTPLANAFTWTFTTAATSPPGSTVRVNSGGGAYTTGAGDAFSADQFSSGGSTFSVTSSIAGTTDDTLYQNERWGQFSYAIPVQNGTYDVRFHFVEIYYGSGGVPGGAGKRVFGMDVDDTAASPDIANLDIYASVGANAALVRTVSGVAVTDGVLNIRSVYGSADDPEVAAIEVIPSGGPPPPPPDQVGSWSTPVSWPLVAVHAVLLPTGNVLAFDGFDAALNSERIWNPTTGTFTPVPYGRNLFCAAHLTLADGRTLIVGGHIQADLGLADTTLFDSATSTWTRAPDMAVGRWYPTAVTLPDGRVFVLSGDNIVQDRPSQTPPFTDASVNSLPSIFDPRTNAWTDITGARLTSPLYPFLFVLADGRVLDAGPDTTSRLFDPATGTWSVVGTSPIDAHTAVMYRPNKIMKSGTWADPDFVGPNRYNATGRTAVLDMSAPTPAWRETAAMANHRAYHNLTMLADGTVLASGGGTTSDGTDLSTAVLPTEIWNPDTETWTTVASLQNGRLYHSTALLLPDARVLMAGGGSVPIAGTVDQKNAEIYSPPYLFKGARPTISSAPATVQYGSSFAVGSSDAASIQSISLVRLPSSTHGYDQDQRFQRLTFTAGAGTLTVDAPANANLAPPGYYMLFIVNGNGVPSVARIVRFPAPWEDSVPPSAPGSLTATGGAGQAALSWTAATDNKGILRYHIHRSTTSGFTASLANEIGTSTTTSFTNVGLAAGTYYYLVRAEDLSGNLGPVSNQATAIVTSGDTQAPTVSITAPTDGATVTATYTVTATASDNVGVSGVQFRLDGAALGAEDTTAPYSIDWVTTGASNGPHTLTAVARDAATNQTTSAPVNVTVSNVSQDPPGLVASWSFDDGSGTSAADRSGRGHLGTLNGPAWTTSGHTAGALSFDGVNDWVTVADANDLDLAAGMTVEAWVRPSALGTIWRTVLIKEQPGDLIYALYANTDTTRPSGHVYVGSDTFIRGTAALALNTWTHLAATYDGATLRLYANGAQVGSRAVPGSMPASGAVLHMGGNAIWGEWFQGILDDVRIYSRALTVTELQGDMNRPVVG